MPSISDMRQAFWGSTDEELATLIALVDSGKVASELVFQEESAKKDPIAGWISNKWYSPPVMSITSTLANEGVLVGTMMLIPAGVSITDLAIEVTIAGSAGALARLGVYRLEENGSISLEVDAGTIDGTVEAVHELPASVAAKSEPWWSVLTTVTQGAASTRPTYRANLPMHQPPMYYTPVSSLMVLLGGAGYFATGVSGALPASGSFNTAASIQRILVKGTN